MKQFNMILFCVLTAFVADFGFTQIALAQDVSQPAVAAPVVVSPAAAPQPAVVAVPAPAAPPAWATELLTTISGLPIVGPYVSQFLLWLGILAAILTTLVGASLSILASLKGAFAYAGLDSAVAAITAFQQGKVMYYLTYFSNFNAKKPVA